MQPLQQASGPLGPQPSSPAPAVHDNNPPPQLSDAPTQDEEAADGQFAARTAPGQESFSHVVFVPHAVCEAKKAREALARLPAAARLFLDVFAGFHAPVTQAVKSLGLDHFQPFDLDADAAFDILHDPTYELLLQVCWSGIVGAALFAPPCKEYSRLKLLPGGPPALRTPELLDGVPGLSPSDLKKVTDSKATTAVAGTSSRP